MIVSRAARPADTIGFLVTKFVSLSNDGLAAGKRCCDGQYWDLVYGADDERSRYPGSTQRYIAHTKVTKWFPMAFPYVCDLDVCTH